MWLRGNTHTHTTYSDGDSPPEVVVDWYAEHGYDFLFLTDHNILIPEDHLAGLQRPGLAVWQGEEITMAAVHVNGLGLQRVVMPEEPGASAAEAGISRSAVERIGWAVEQVEAQDGAAAVNHPNYLWKLTAEDMLASGKFPLLEISNGHPLSFNDGDDVHPSVEQMWDRLLTAGQRAWGVASDDAHHFTTWGSDRSNPGRGWLYVQSDSTRLPDCLDALREGRFCASSGPELSDYRGSRAEIALDLACDRAQVDLVGLEGRVLETIDTESARFDLRRYKSPYVRIRATDSAGRRLWTQPVFL